MTISIAPFHGSCFLHTWDLLLCCNYLTSIADPVLMFSCTVAVQKQYNIWIRISVDKFLCYSVLDMRMAASPLS